MASIKQRSAGQNQLASKIKISKPKVGVGQSGVGGANRILCESGARSFKVYSESTVVTGNSRIRKSMPVIKASTMAGPSVQKGVSESTEIEKNMNEDPTKPILRRRALADVSNVKGNIVSKNAARNSLKLSSKVSSDLGTRTKNVMSRKSIQGSVPGGLKQVVVGSKYLKAPSNSQRNTATRLSRDFTASNGRTVRTSLIPTRKPKPVGTADIPKGNSGSPKVTKGEIKVAAGRKIVARVSTSRTQLWRNRVSDGFLIRGQNAVDSRTVLRKSIMPPAKTAARVSTFTRNKKSNETKRQSKLSMVSTTTTKNDQSAKSSVCENLTEESIQGQVSSEGDCKPSTSEAVTKKVSRRRKSYTSSLMEGHKLLEQCRDVSEQEKVASIDDKGNQLEVADYIDEIYQYYWVTEAQIPNMGNYMSIQKDITPHMRAVLVDWLIEVHLKYDLMQETLYLMISLLDRYLSEVVVKKDEVQLVGLTALLLASKYEDYWHPKVKELIALSAESHTRGQMLDMEKLILKKLKFRLNMPTPYVFMLRFLKASQADKELKHLAFYLTDLCLVEYEALKFKPSLLCASAIYVARSTLKMTEPWTPLLRRHARYDEPQLRECAEMVLRFHKAARKGRLKVTYEKYMSADLSRVAAMKPLETLPL